MASTKSFGRRAGAQPAQFAKTPRETASPVAIATHVEQSTISIDQLPPADTSPSVDDELREWKQTRRRTIPWRQISLMASLSFGIASVVLTGTVAEAVDWLLYGLSAASLYFWWSGRGKRSPK